MNELSRQPMFFLGANAPGGFVSVFHNSYCAEDGWHTYIIKGGPGTGKSTLMKRVAAYFIKEGVRCRLCPCSSDPQSLDAVIFPDLKITIMDGTAPHIVEPRYPGACEEIINLGEAWNPQKLSENREKILLLSKANHDAHRKASGYITAAGCLIEDSAFIARAATDIKKAECFALRLAKKTIPKTTANGCEWLRYLSGITPKGPMFYRKTIEKMCDDVIVISDDSGGASPVILDTVRRYAIGAGHEIISCYCPMQPKTKCEHIIIPALKLAFSTKTRYHSAVTSNRIIHARRFTNAEKLHEERLRLSYNRRAAADLIAAATDTLAEAKALHDELERCYITAMDFDSMNRRTEEIVQKIQKQIENM